MTDRPHMLSLVFSAVALGVSMAGMMGSLIVERSPTIAVVDLQKILQEASHTLAKSYPKGDVPKAVLDTLIHQIKDATKAYGRSHNRLILAKPALLSDASEDLTQAILHELSQGKTAHE